MKASVRAVLSLIAVLSVFAVIPPGVAAQGGLETTVSPQCVVALPGTTVTSQVTGSTGQGSGGQVGLTLVGAFPHNSSLTVAPASGASPLDATISMRIENSTQASGSYQLGILARSGDASKLTLFTLQVLNPGANISQALECSQVGLPIPTSTFVVAATSIGLGLTTQVATRLLVDLNSERRMKTEVNAFNKEKRAATLSKDTAKLDKLKKKEPAIKQTQAKISSARLKVVPITFLPLLAFYYLMTPLLGGYNIIVALSPFSIPYLTESTGVMVLFWWYLVCSFTFSSLLAKLLRTTT
ncbi:MAG: DUF106 domain-containing protein [Thaumarchaeota archaeon]|nr:DUF106 domain-containing protein [Nitrososphaerota archaeon]